MNTHQNNLGAFRRATEYLGAAALLLCAWLVPTTASAVAFSQCPSVGYAVTCNVLISIDSVGTVSTTVDGSVPAYDGSEDMLVGVENLWDKTIASLTLSGSNIFGFDSDGASQGGGDCTIDGTGGTYGCPAALSPTGYEGLVAGDSSRLVTFNVADNDNGDVIFAGGLAPGETAWFSLEEPPTASISGTANTVPEPAMLSLMGLGLVGLGWTRRRSSKV